MKKFLILFLIFLISCAPSEEQIQEQIDQAVNEVLDEQKNDNQGFSGIETTTTTQLVCSQFDRDELPPECIEIERINNLPEKCNDIKRQIQNNIRNVENGFAEYYVGPIWESWVMWLLDDDKKLSLEEASSRKQEVIDAFINTSEIWTLSTSFYPIDFGENYELLEMETDFYTVVNTYTKSLRLIGEFVTDTPRTDAEQLSYYEIYQDFKNEIYFYSSYINDFNCNF